MIMSVIKPDAELRTEAKKQGVMTSLCLLEINDYLFRKLTCDPKIGIKKFAHIFNR
jgi:hypothetical protein